jgi:alkanesulfonate monooxygenase SsuD/methylene tetrahydromethanopterin reductase-like flavin-dependent oxidoreductase (luciferase family)
VTFRLGFQTHVHGREPARELYPAILDLFVAAEELGFDSGWVAQHHLHTDEGRMPSPLVLLSAVAARTDRIRLGTAIVALPLEDPLRASEDAAVLDALSDGRLELGVGSGNPTQDEFTAFGKTTDQRHALYAAHLATLRSALAGEPLPGGLRLSPEALSLLDRIWQSPLSEERVRSVAASGDGILLGIGPASTVQLELAKAYLDSFVGERPRLAVVHSAFPGESREERAAAIWPDVKKSLGFYARAGWVSEDAEAAELLPAMNIHHGTVDQIIASLAAEPVIELASDLVLAVQAESTSVDAAIRTLETIATRIAPALGWQPATASIATTSLTTPSIGLRP